MHPIQKQLYDLDKLRSLIDNSDIEIIKKKGGTLKNQILFDEKYYHEGFPKIVLCGINPGRKGAGVTGVPFVDMATLAKRLPDANISFSGKGTEKSAQYFNEIVNHKEFGVKKFYKKFYVTNLSWVGFTKDNINYNYYDIKSKKAKEYIYEAFINEMKVIKPDVIIPIGAKVKKTLDNLSFDSNITIAKAVTHPGKYAYLKKPEIDNFQKLLRDVLLNYIRD